MADRDLSWDRSSVLGTRSKKNGQNRKSQCRSSALMERKESGLLLIYSHSHSLSLTHTHTGTDTVASTSARWEHPRGDKRCCACCCQGEGDMTPRVTGTHVLILHQEWTAELRERITESSKKNPLTIHPTVPCPNPKACAHSLTFTFLLLLWSTKMFSKILLCSWSRTKHMNPRSTERVLEAVLPRSFFNESGLVDSTKWTDAVQYNNTNNQLTP